MHHPSRPRRASPFHRRRLAPPQLRLASYRLNDMLGGYPSLSSRRNVLFFFFFSLFLLASIYCLILLGVGRSAFSWNPDVGLPPAFLFSPVGNSSHVLERYKLENVLRDAAMKDRTVILTTLNEAWAAPGSVIDLFLESFRIGDGTRRLLKHLVIIALDMKAFSRCISAHTHCVALVTEGVDFSSEAYFMTADYLKMMWRRVDFLCSILEMGYNFVFTDADVMWFRNPFTQFFLDADLQIACDHFVGDSEDIDNKPNGGFNYVRSNNRSIEFYKFWYSSRETFPGYHDQDVFNFIKYDPFITEIGIKIRFLDTEYFGGLCEPSKDLNQVCTMHVNCCFGLESKLHDLRIMLQDWKIYLSLPPALKRSLIMSWRVPQNCSLDSLQQYGLPVNDTQ